MHVTTAFINTFRYHLFKQNMALWMKLLDAIPQNELIRAGMTQKAILLHSNLLSFVRVIPKIMASILLFRFIVGSRAGNNEIADDSLQLSASGHCRNRLTPVLLQTTYLSSISSYIWILFNDIWVVFQFLNTVMIYQSIKKSTRLRWADHVAGIVKVEVLSKF